VTELGFDFDLFDHASNPAGRIENALEGVNHALKDVKKSVSSFEDEHKSSMAGAGASSVAFGNIMSAVAIGAVTAAKDIAVAIGQMAVSAAVDLGKASVEAAAFRETSELALTALRHGESGVAQFEHIKDIALDMGTPLKDTVKQFQKLAAMQFSEGEAETFFKRMQDLRAVGSDAEQTGRALVAITQIKSAGKLQGDELNQLAEAGVSVQLVLEEIAKASGKTVPEVMKLKEAGKVTAEMALDAIDKAIGRKTGAAVAGDAGRAFIENTVQGMSERLMNLKGVIMDDVAQAFMPAFKEVLPALGRAFDALDSDKFKDFLAGVGAAFGRVLSAVMKLEPLVGDVFVSLTGDTSSSLIDTIADALVTVIDGVRTAWPLVKEFVTGFSTGFGDAWTGFEIFAKSIASALGGGDMQSMTDVARTLGEAFGKWAVILIEVAAAVGVVIGVIGALTASLVAVVDFFFNLAEQASQAGQRLGAAFGEGIRNAIAASIAGVQQAAADLAHSIPAPIQSILGIHSPSDVGYDLGFNVGEGKALGMWDSIPMVQGAANDIGEAAMPFMASPQAAVGAGRSSQRISSKTNQTFNFGGPGDAESVGKAARDGASSGHDDLFERIAFELAG